MDQKTIDFIEKANRVHDNRYDYDLVEYINGTTKVTIICNEHDKFDQILDTGQ